MCENVVNALREAKKRSAVWLHSDLPVKVALLVVLLACGAVRMDSLPSLRSLCVLFRCYFVSLS